MTPRIDPRLCAVCRGRGWCGLTYCPLLARRMASFKLRRVIGSTELYGSSPPSVFVGRYGYPVVNVGPSTPPVTGDTSVYDLPEKWLDLKIEDILSYRWSLITGSNRLSVDAPRRPDRFLEDIYMIVLSAKPVDVELKLAKPPKPSIVFSEYEPPQGPRAPLERIRVVGNPSIPRPVDKVFNDVDLKAGDAITILYRYGIPVTMIQKVLSIGGLGTWKRRRLVPTRWSITAVDSTISEHLIGKVKEYEEIGEIVVYLRRFYDNLFIVILYPGRWSYEWMEAWWPGSTWNPGSGEVVVEADHEEYMGRATYPEIGGCYYASRLAVAEHLYSIRRQATVIALREIYPGFNIPIGVWFVRENMRRLFRDKPVLRTSDFRDVIKLLDRETRLGAGRWVKESYLLRRILYQRSIMEFIGAGRE